MNTALVLSYLGTGYHGWQRQQNGMTIQQLLEDALEKTCGVRAHISGCGRTDAGVHAKYYVASTRADISIPPERLPAALNSRLPQDVVIHHAVNVSDDFDARFSCKSKEYTYLILNRATRDPFFADRAYFFPRALDIKAMSECAAIFAGKRDFASLMSAGSPVKSTVRTVYYCTAERSGDFISIKVRADGFLYNMVRAIAGTLVYCGLHKLNSADIEHILSGSARELAGPTAPACGLYMTALTYDMEALDGQA